MLLLPAESGSSKVNLQYAQGGSGSDAATGPDAGAPGSGAAPPPPAPAASPSRTEASEFNRLLRDGRPQAISKLFHFQRSYITAVAALATKGKQHHIAAAKEGAEDAGAADAYAVVGGLRFYMHPLGISITPDRKQHFAQYGALFHDDTFEPPKVSGLGSLFLRNRCGRGILYLAS